MTFKKSCRLSLGLALAANLSVGAATTIDFDDFTLGDYQNSFSENGWTFEAETAGLGPVNMAVEAAGLQGGGADQVVAFGFNFVEGSPINLVSIGTSDGQEFKLVGLSLGDISGNSNLSLEAYRDGDPTGYSPVTVDIFNTVEVVNFTGWDNLDEIRITNSTGASDLAFDIDDMVIAEAVPEPGVTGLVFFGSLLMLAKRRRS
jgi:hypothetical protein